MTEPIARNYRNVLAEIAAACQRAQRDIADVRLVAVTKSATLEQIRALYDLGVRDLAESRPQQLSKRAAELPGDVCWHMIGHLQRNKVDSVVDVARWIHSIDSPRLVDAVAKSFQSRKSLQFKPMNFLLEVNVSGEASKGGFTPAEVRDFWQCQIEQPSLPIGGLMTMAPADSDPETARRTFRSLRLLRDEMESLPGSSALPHLSMGMSGDYVTAIEEGATLVRVGTLLFAE